MGRNQPISGQDEWGAEVTNEDSRSFAGRMKDALPGLIIASVVTVMLRQVVGLFQ